VGYTLLRLDTEVPHSLRRLLVVTPSSSNQAGFGVCVRTESRGRLADSRCREAALTRCFCFGKSCINPFSNAMQLVLTRTLQPLRDGCHSQRTNELHLDGSRANRTPTRRTLPRLRDRERMRPPLHFFLSVLGIIEVEERFGLRLQAEPGVPEAILFRSEHFRSPKTALPDPFLFEGWRPYPHCHQRLADGKRSRNGHPPPGH
jgi:hypothetical protein